MLKWDTKIKTWTGKGILGTVQAFAGTDKEQGQKTLHQHWQIWVEEIDQTLRNDLFDNDHKQWSKLDRLFKNMLTML